MALTDEQLAALALGEQLPVDPLEGGLVAEAPVPQQVEQGPGWLDQALAATQNLGQQATVGQAAAGAAPGAKDQPMIAGALAAAQNFGQRYNEFAAQPRPEVVPEAPVTASPQQPEERPRKLSQKPGKLQEQITTGIEEGRADTANATNTKFEVDEAAVLREAEFSDYMANYSREEHMKIAADLKRNEEEAAAIIEQGKAESKRMAAEQRRLLSEYSQTQIDPAALFRGGAGKGFIAARAIGAFLTANGVPNDLGEQSREWVRNSIEAQKQNIVLKGEAADAFGKAAQDVMQLATNQAQQQTALNVIAIDALKRQIDLEASRFDSERVWLNANKAKAQLDLEREQQLLKLETETGESIMKVAKDAANVKQSNAAAAASYASADQTRKETKIMMERREEELRQRATDFSLRPDGTRISGVNFQNPVMDGQGRLLGYGLDEKSTQALRNEVVDASVLSAKVTNARRVYDAVAKEKGIVLNDRGQPTNERDALVLAKDARVAAAVESAFSSVRTKDYGTALTATEAPKAAQKYGASGDLWEMAKGTFTSGVFDLAGVDVDDPRKASALPILMAAMADGIDAEVQTRVNSRGYSVQRIEQQNPHLADNPTWKSATRGTPLVTRTVGGQNAEAEALDRARATQTTDTDETVKRIVSGEAALRPIDEDTKVALESKAGKKVLESMYGRDVVNTPTARFLHRTKPQPEGAAKHPVEVAASVGQYLDSVVALVDNPNATDEQRAVAFAEAEEVMRGVRGAAGNDLGASSWAVYQTMVRSRDPRYAKKK